MNTSSATRRTLLSAAAIAALVLAPRPGGVAHAATVAWTGFGASSWWSDPLNWNPEGPPAEGSDLLFNGLRPHAVSVLDVSRSFSSITFGADAAAFELHVSGEASTVLDLAGAGLRNLTAGSGPIRQMLVADAGSGGGTLRFSGSAGVNLGLGQSARAVEITAGGAGVAGQSGGHIVFQDQASIGSDTFDVLRVQGAFAAGALAADLSFRGSALADRFSTIVVSGATAAASMGGRVNFADQARGAGTITVLAGIAGGAGGRVEVTGSAVLDASASLFHEGAGVATFGAEAATSLRGDARMIGSAQNRPGTAFGAQGGRIEFFDHASHDTVGLDPSLGTQIILNAGASVSGAGAGRVVFHDDSAVLGTQLFIQNATAEGSGLGTVGGSTTFADRSRAGAVSIDNAGTGGSGGFGGTTYFVNQADAQTASLVMRGGYGAAASGGYTLFNDDATAGTARLRNEGGAADDALGGSTRFTGRAAAGGAAIVNAGGSAPGASGGAALFEGSANAGRASIENGVGLVDGAHGGVTTFAGSSGAGSATITNRSNLNTLGGGRGTTAFTESSSAENATIDNLGGIASTNAFTTFQDSATAGNARITNFGGRAFGVRGSSTEFTDQTSAGTATLVMMGGAVNGALGGQATFFAFATAAGATLDVRGAAVAGAAGGRVDFQNFASAGHATVLVQGSQADNPGGPEGAIVHLGSNSTAGNASFTIGGNLFASGRPGLVQFDGAATAADASFDTLAGFDAGGRLTFEGSGSNAANAGNARITNGSRTTGASLDHPYGGATIFLARSSADHAHITNEAGRTEFGAQTVFNNDSTAADATIVNAGGRTGDTGGITFFQQASSAGRAVISNQAGGVNASGITYFDDTASAARSSITAAGATASGDIGGRVIFTDTSTAAQATLVAEGGSNGGAGGRIEFQQHASGGSARLVLNAGSSASAGGVLDISGVDVWLTVGSLEGGGHVRLGARSLVVAGTAQPAATFSGVIEGSTPPVFPSLSVLGGTLTLTGANVYSGRTSIGDGVNAGSGKLVAANSTGSATGSGEVVIERGGTLAGSGFIAGPVTLRSGGAIVPGDPVTLTLRDSLLWDGGGVIRLVVGADDAGSDHLVVHRLVRGAPGSFVIQLIDAGFTPGASYALLQFDEMEGFAALDFSVTGLSGSVSLGNGILGFTAAVPEPPVAALLIAGLLVLRRRRRHDRAPLRILPARLAGLPDA